MVLYGAVRIGLLPRLVILMNGATTGLRVRLLDDKE